MTQSMKLAIFDFDGTLADSFPFFVATYNELALRHRFRSVRPDEVAALRRASPREIMRHVGLSATMLPRVAADFIGRMRERRSSISPFPGAAELLLDLRQRGVVLGIVSSNAYDNVAAILGPETIGAVPFHACGMSIFGKRTHLKTIIRRSGIPRSAAIYIGDQHSDLEAAHAVGVAFGAVAWGYGDFESLKAAGADRAFQEIDDIARLFPASAFASPGCPRSRR